MTLPGTASSLNPADGIKPLDFGAEGVTGSVDAYGRLIALNTLHHEHGYVTLTTAAPFPEDRRYDPAAVRAYREALAALPGLGPDLSGQSVQREAFLLDDAVPHVRLALPDTTATSTTFAVSGGAIQVWHVEGAPLRCRGPVSLQRCAYTQLTEGGPISPPSVQTRLTFRDGVLVVENPALGMAAAVAGLPDGPSWTRTADGPAAVDLGAWAGTVTLAYAFGRDAAQAAANARALAGQNAAARLDDVRQGWRARWHGIPDDRLVRRGLSYGLRLAVPVGETICILTDHMLLPLSWNRDAYYVARMLLSWNTPEAADIVRRTVRRHLLWMFETAERPGGTWGRCYLANGRIKDHAFQLDQQVCPLLELADYVTATGDHHTLDRLAAHVPAVIDTLLARRAGHTWLFPTDETPADDPVALPYHLSSHILMWHTFRQLGRAGIAGDWDTLADSVRAAVMAHFITGRGGQRLYAYATDARGVHHLYHDANDVPLALAPAWGFTDSHDPVWRATVDFAFSSANRGGWYGSGLGSVHTPAPWPLGDIQAILVARAMREPDRKQRALERLRRAAQWDGALPEAYDPQTYAVTSRHWFAWPNALLAGVVLGAYGRTQTG